MFNYKIQFRKTFELLFGTQPAKSRDEQRTFTQDELESFAYKYYEEMLGQSNMRDLRVIRILWFCLGFIFAIGLLVYVLNSNK